MPAKNLHLGMGVDVRDFARFARALRIAAPEIRRDLLLRLAEAAEVVAEDARARASEASETVAESIRVRAGTLSISVVAGRASLPLAGLLELGNKGGAADVFRHPVFGHDVWVDQAMHPFLAPAVKANFEVFERKAVDALDIAIATAVSHD